MNSYLSGEHEWGVVSTQPSNEGIKNVSKVIKCNSTMSLKSSNVIQQDFKIKHHDKKTNKFSVLVLSNQL